MRGISAVVATYKRKKELQRLLDSVIANNITGCEIIIADQNTDGLIDDIVEAYSKELQIVHIKLTEANQSKARNYGAAFARYDVLCFPDDDCWFEPDALRKVNDHFEDSDTELLVINWKQNPHRHNSSKFISAGEIYSFRSVGYVTYVLFFKTCVFNSLGGFMENVGIGQYIGGGEDSELTFRTVHNGFLIYYDASVGVNHNYIPVTTRSYKIIRARQRGMGLMYALYNIPASVIIKGLIAPVIKMLLAFNISKMRQQYNMFLGRTEGLLYGLKHKKNYMGTISRMFLHKSAA